MSSSAKEDWLAQTPESKHSLAPAPEGNLPENNPSKDANVWTYFFQYPLGERRWGS